MSSHGRVRVPFCVSVGDMGDPPEIAERIKVLFERPYSYGPKNHALDGRHPANSIEWSVLGNHAAVNAVTDAALFC